MVVEVLIKSMFFANNTNNLLSKDAISILSPLRIKLEIMRDTPFLGIIKDLNSLKEGRENLMIQKTVLVWTEKAEDSDSLSELDSLHGNPSKQVFGNFENNKNAGGQLIYAGLSLPDIRLIGVVVGTLLNDLKRKNPAELRLEMEEKELDAMEAEVLRRNTDATEVRFTTTRDTRTDSLASFSGTESTVLNPPILVEENRHLTQFDDYWEDFPTNLQVVVGLADTRLALVNNVMGIPLLSLLLKDTSVNVSQITNVEGLFVSASLVIQGSYFNHADHLWDPLIETTAVQVEVRKSLDPVEEATKVSVALHYVFLLWGMLAKAEMHT